MPEFPGDPEIVTLTLRGEAIDLSQLGVLITSFDRCLYAVASGLLPLEETNSDIRRLLAEFPYGRPFRTRVEVRGGSIILAVTILLAQHPHIAAKLAHLGYHTIHFIGQKVSEIANAAVVKVTADRIGENFKPKAPTSTPPPIPSPLPSFCDSELTAAVKEIVAIIATSPTPIEFLLEVRADGSYAIVLRKG